MTKEIKQMLDVTQVEDNITNISTTSTTIPESSKPVKDDLSAGPEVVDYKKLYEDSLKEKEAILSKNKEIIGEKRAIQEKVKSYGQATPEEIEALRAKVAGQEAKELELQGSYQEAQKLREAEAQRILENERKQVKTASDELAKTKAELQTLKLDNVVLAKLAASDVINASQAYKLIKEDLVLIDNIPSAKLGGEVLSVDEYLARLKQTDPNLFKAPTTSGYGLKPSPNSNLAGHADIDYQAKVDAANRALDLAQRKAAK